MTSDIPIVDWNQLQSLRILQEEGEPDVVAQVIDMFQEDSAARLNRAREAFANGDVKALKLEAHSLKGTAGIIGAAPLGEAAAALERLVGSAETTAIAPYLAAMADAVAAVRAELARGPL